MSRGNILVADDSKNVLIALDMLLSPEFDNVTCISGPKTLASELRQRSYNVVLLDMNFKPGANTGNEGLYWLKRIKREHPGISVVPITAYGDVELAVRALKEGATDFVLKPWDNNKLLATVRSAAQLSISKNEVNNLRNRERELKSNFNREEKEIVGKSPELANVLKLVDKVAGTDTNVLVTGENGTGKELIARRIHSLSPRRQELMVTVDMGALSETLFESELFGHVKGAFTDARDDRRGKFELASGGTLFLDEISNLPFNLQSKMLASLQNREITRVGSNTPVPLDIRLISATNRDLNAMAEEGLFRKDLLYRINTIRIEIPPLRNRKKDIPVLVDYFLEKYSARYSKSPLEITEEAMGWLIEYRWPGNVRELQHAVERAVILNESGRLTIGDFFHGSPELGETDMDIMRLDEMEEKMIRMAIERNAGNIKAAAEQLGITRQTIYNKMKRAGIISPDTKRENSGDMR